jgi:arylsulfatase A-like enzyme
MPNTSNSTDRPPNIIFILVDDMRWDQLGITGHPFAKTPNIDRIGTEGVVFKNAFVTTPLCSPSRASFLTGQYPHQHRIINNDSHGLSYISHKLVTFPQLLRRAGYETGFIGKLHMGDDDSRRPGFDHWIGFKGQGLFIDPVVNIDDRREQCTGYMTDLLNGWAVDFVNKPRTKPFVLFLGHKAVHGPYIPAERHANLYADQKFVPPASASDDLSGKPALTRKVPPVDVLRMAGATPEPSEPRHGRGTSQEDIYLDHIRCLAAVDEGVGKLFDALEKLGQLDDTLIIFASDNGFLFGEHGQFMNKRVAYEESVRIPLLMRYPKLIERGATRDQLVLNIDIAPTLYELAGIEAPVPIHGKSLLPVFRDRTHELRTQFLGEYFVELVDPKYADWQAVRTPRWKYIHYPDLTDMDELYDLEHDPHEMENVIASSDAAGQLKELRKALAELLQVTGAKTRA